jgi:hypothetical protein
LLLLRQPLPPLPGANPCQPRRSVSLYQRFQLCPRPRLRRCLRLRPASLWQRGWRRPGLLSRRLLRAASPCRLLQLRQRTLFPSFPLANRRRPRRSHQRQTKPSRLQSGPRSRRRRRPQSTSRRSRMSRRNRRPQPRTLRRRRNRRFTPLRQRRIRLAGSLLQCVSSPRRLYRRRRPRLIWHRPRFTCSRRQRLRHRWFMRPRRQRRQRLCFVNRRPWFASSHRLGNRRRAEGPAWRPVRGSIRPVLTPTPARRRPASSPAALADGARNLHVPEKGAPAVEAFEERLSGRLPRSLPTCSGEATSRSGLKT